MDAISIALFIAMIVALLMLAFVAYKVWRAHLMLYAVRQEQTRVHRQMEQIYRQTEALLGLYRELRLERSLPTTRGWAASPDFLLHLARHALTRKPATVVECGSGVSTVALARCMQINGRGHVFSLEHDEHFAKKTRENLAYHGLSDWATVLYAPLRPHALDGSRWLWYSEERLPVEIEIDLLVVDGPPMITGSLARYPAAPLLFSKLSANAAVFLDDAKRREERGVVERWKRYVPTASFEERDCEKGCVVVTNAHSTGDCAS